MGRGQWGGVLCVGGGKGGKTYASFVRASVFFCFAPPSLLPTHSLTICRALARLIKLRATDASRPAGAAGGGIGLRGVRINVNGGRSWACRAQHRCWPPRDVWRCVRVWKGGVTVRTLVCRARQTRRHCVFGCLGKISHFNFFFA